MVNNFYNDIRQLIIEIHSTIAGELNLQLYVKERMNYSILRN